MATRWESDQPGEEGIVDVLFVGPDSELAEMYRLKLELDGYRVRTLTTLRDWSRPPRNRRPDLVFLDLDQPERAALAEIGRLRSDPVLKGVPAILLSNQTAEQLAEGGITLAPQEYLLRARPSSALSQSVADWSSAPSPSWLPASRQH
ncbi:MAG TPA: response regulator [Candidatus Dormibacteraeota bacterium]